MLWTVYKIFMVVWMLELVLRFGGSALQIVLVVSCAALAGHPWRLFQRRQIARVCEDRKAQLRIIGQFAGDSKINSSFHNRT